MPVPEIEPCPVTKVVRVYVDDAVVVRVALHDAVVPPLSPVQLHVYVLVFVVTDDGVPTEQRFVVGAEEKVPPLLVPQEPF
jgi:hypothetical protein